MSTFDGARCTALLTTERFGRPLVVLAETDSTMDDARAAADEGCVEGHLILADHQRQGRVRVTPGQSAKVHPPRPEGQLFRSQLASCPKVMIRRELQAIRPPRSNCRPDPAA